MIKRVTLYPNKTASITYESGHRVRYRRIPQTAREFIKTAKYEGLLGPNGLVKTYTKKGA